MPYCVEMPTFSGTTIGATNFYAWEKSVDRIFISFAGEDAALADFLSRTLNHIFQGHARFFSSSGGLQPGVVWLDRLKSEIRSADTVLMLLSPHSFDRPWINIEAGAFWANDKTILPLLHGGLTASDIHRPLADYQAININSPHGIASLLGILALRIGLSAPPLYDPEQLCESIAVLDRGAMKLLRTWTDVMDELEIQDSQPRAERLESYEITKELDAGSYRLLRENTVELNGYSSDSLLFTFRRHRSLDTRRFFIVECENTAATKSLEYGLFMKVNFNNNVPLPYLPYHRHSRDEQFTGKGDGFFPYDVSFTQDVAPVVFHIILWRSVVNRLRLRMYFV